MLAPQNSTSEYLKAGFHWRRSRSRSLNQKHRAIGSSENRINQRSWKQNTDSAYDSLGYEQMKTALSESQTEAEE